jgi:hypothetical protein
LSFDSVQGLRYHCHDSQGIDLIKFTPLKSRTRGKKRSVEASSGPESKKRRIDFVNETVETLSSPDRLIPEDEASGKPRRGRPRKYPARVSKGESSVKKEVGGKARGRPRKQPALVSKGESGVKMGAVRPLRRESSAALSSTVQGKHGRKKKRIRYTVSPAGSSTRSASSQSRTALSSTELEGKEFQRDPDHETTSLSSWSASNHDASLGLEPGNEAGSESDSEYELVELGTHGSYWVSRKGRGVTTSAQGVATRPQVVIYV